MLKATMKRVLLIDDDEPIRRLLTLVLESSNYQVTASEDGRQAMNLLKKERFDLIVSDLMMPVMDGMRFLRWLRKEAKLPIPVLVMTALEKPGTEAKVKQAGASGVLFKPVSMPTFLQAVGSL